MEMADDTIQTNKMAGHHKQQKIDNINKEEEEKKKRVLS